MVTNYTDRIHYYTTIHSTYTVSSYCKQNNLPSNGCSESLEKCIKLISYRSCSTFYNRFWVHSETSIHQSQTHHFHTCTAHFFSSQTTADVKKVQLYQIHCPLKCYFTIPIIQNSWTWPTKSTEWSFLRKNNEINVTFLEHKWQPASTGSYCLLTKYSHATARCEWWLSMGN